MIIQVYEEMFVNEKYFLLYFHFKSQGIVKKYKTKLSIFGCTVDLSTNLFSLFYAHITEAKNNMTIKILGDCAPFSNQMNVNWILMD